MSGDSGSNDGGTPPANDEVSHDALGDTQLGRSLKELIKEIGREKEALKQAMDPAQAQAPGQQEAEEDFDPSQTRFDKALELAARAARDMESPTNGAEEARAPSPAADGEKPTPQPQTVPAARTGADAEADAGEAAIAEAVSGLEAVLRSFAEAERRRAEEHIAQWKVQLKKATMIVIKKQVDAARARWMQNRTANEAKVAEHYQRLKALADKVARQKEQIQLAKRELEKKLEVADRLHNEFDEIRSVLDGQIGAIDALEENGDALPDASPRRDDQDQS